MCKSLLSTIGKSSLLVVFFFSLLFLASSLATTSAQSQPVAVSSASSPDGSTNPQISSQPMPQLPPPPELPMMQLDKSKPINEQQRQALDAWINFWTGRELPWRAQLQAWLAAVKASWTLQKSLGQKQAIDTDAALKAKDDVIAALIRERDVYKAELQRKNAWAPIENGLYAFGGLGLGYLAGHFTK